jgi:hypothetical protein
VPLNDGAGPSLTPGTAFSLMLIGAVIGAVAMWSASSGSRNELPSVSLPEGTMRDWLSKSAGVLREGREKILASLDR